MNRTLARRRHLEANPINATQVALIGVGVIGGAAIVSAITRSSSATVSVLAAAGIIAIAYNAGKRKRNPIEETTQTYQVLLGNQSRVEHALEALSKRAKRKGLSPVTWSWGKAYVVEKERVPHPEYGYKVEYTADVARIPLTIVGGNPHYEGWTFIAVLEHLDGENIVRVLPGHELPKQYRECSPVCGHCNFNRKRNDTYVLRHDDGKYIQVGSTCIKDFLGSDDAGKVASAASYIADVRDIAEGGEEGYGEGGGSNASALLQYLPYVAYVVRKDGWVSKTAAREKGGLATASVAARYLYDKEARRKDNVQLEAQDELMAESAEAWAENLSDAAIDAETGDYLHNLRVIARSGVVTPRSEGLAASMVIAYQRAVGRERDRAERAARPTLDAYVGEAYGLDVYDIEILYDVTRKHGNGSRRLPPPGFSLVYDRHYSKLKKLGLIRWVQVDPVYASMGDDHYVLSDTGKQVLHGPSANPLAMGKTERNVFIGAGILGAAAIAYELFKSKPAAASTNPGTIVMPPVTIVSPGQPNQTATGTNNVDTSFTGSDGQQISMTVGDTVSVDLPVPPGATSFSFSAIGTALQGGAALADSTQYMQVWTAGSTGTSTVVFQAIDAGNNPVGQQVQFTAVVS